MTTSTARIVAVVGPTGIGKTKLSITLAEAFGGEVVSTDSLQVYRVGKIMTAQATAAEMKGVRHHMINFLEPTEEPFHFVEQAINCIAGIHRRGKVAIICGGSTTLTEPLLFHPLVKQHKPFIIALYSKMATLGKLTDRRVESMLQEGLLEEAQEMYELQKSADSTGHRHQGVWKAIGYRELLPYLAEPDIETFSMLLHFGTRQMKRQTRKYADKQLTWLWSRLLPALHCHQLDCLMLRVDGPSTFNEDVELPAVSHCQRRLTPTIENDNQRLNSEA